MKTSPCHYNPNMHCPDGIWICPLDHESFMNKLERYFGRRGDDVMGRKPLSGDDLATFLKSVTYWLFPLNGDSPNLDSTFTYVEQFFLDNTGMTPDVCRVLNAALVNFERIQSDHADRFFEGLR